MALIAATIAGALVCFFLWLLMALFSTRLKLRPRVVALSGGRTAEALVDEADARSRPRRKLRNRERREWLLPLSNALIRADIPLSSRDYALRWLLLTAALAGVGDLVLGLLGAVLFLAICWVATAIYLRMRTARRLKQFNEGLPDLLTVVSNSLKAGHSFAQALHIVCEDLHGPIQAEIIKVEQEAQLGLSLDDALARAADRIGSEDFSLIVTAIGIQRQLGGNLSEVLDKTGNTIRDRIRIQREVKMLTAQGRMSAFIFMVLPIAVGLMLYVFNPAYMGVMFTTPLGVSLLAVAAVGQLIGFFFIRRIVSVSL